jgi:hypothetical protein
MTGAVAQTRVAGWVRESASAADVVCEGLCTAAAEGVANYKGV